MQIALVQAKGTGCCRQVVAVLAQALADKFPLELIHRFGQADVGSWHFRRTACSIEQAFETLRAQGKPATASDLANLYRAIPPDENAAHDYMLGSRSALEWLIDRYQIKTDKASGIVNDPNDWCDEHDDPTYIVDLIKKVTTVSVSTVELVAQLAALNPSTPFTARCQGRGRELRRVRFSPA